ncbi:DUF2238 domain-containing protein [Ideonella sp.]|uniref:DUF2238 domain-containing protein n=1 Tax=Ideonella sp. TaxID=1929293 RepID=UPI003BB54D19
MTRIAQGLWLLVVLALLASAVAPFDRTTWWMEVAPTLVAMPLLWLTRRRFPLTPLLLGLIAVHCLILIYGGAYSYARVPLGFWLQELLGTARNPYDRIGHFAQGFVPALIAREILLRNGIQAGAKLLGFLCLCVAMAISAWYELIEWAAALALGQGADEFLGSQGDVWDTQTDMFCAMLGALCALTLLSRWHDRMMARLTWPTPPDA